MKKYVMGFAIVVTFLVYSMVLRHQHSEPVVAPISLSQNNATSSESTKKSAGSSTTGAGSTSSTPTTNSTTPASQYKDGTYTGDIEDAFYGNVQISVTIQNGKITTVNFLESPDENPNSIYVNQQADPYLKQEAIQAQSSKVSVVTGATFTSQAFIQSLASALSQAKQG